MEAATTYQSCPSCGDTKRNPPFTTALNIYRCGCDKQYCDNCSGGGLIDLPRCPVSPYHESIRKVAELQPITPQQSGRNETATGASQAQPTDVVDESVKPTGYLNARTPADAAQLIFDRALPAVPRLSDDRILYYFKAWGGDDVSDLHKESYSDMHTRVEAHLQRLSSDTGFQNFRIQAYEYRRCVFVEAFCTSYASLLLIWKRLDGSLAATATAPFLSSSRKRESPAAASVASSRQDSKAAQKVVQPRKPWWMFWNRSA